MNKPGRIVIALCVFLLASLLVFAEKNNMAKDGLNAINNGAKIIDVRTVREFGNGHLQGSVNIPYEVIVDRISEVTPNKTDLIVVYCRKGRRSGIAQRSLNLAGYTNVVNGGGYSSLQELIQQAIKVKK